jgi:hypothetical protein
MISLLAGPALRRRAVPLIAMLCAWLAGAATAAASCMAVAGAPPRFMPAAFDKSQIAPGHVGVTFLGHASFLIESPGGVSIVTDYNGYIKPDFIPDIVTMNDKHFQEIRGFAVSVSWNASSRK